MPFHMAARCWHPTWSTPCCSAHVSRLQCWVCMGFLGHPDGIRIQHPGRVGAFTVPSLSACSAFLLLQGHDSVADAWSALSGGPALGVGSDEAPSLQGSGSHCSEEVSLATNASDGVSLATSASEGASLATNTITASCEPQSLF